MRPGFARWLNSTNDVTRRFLAAGRIPGLINIAGGLPAPQTYPAAELAEIARQVIADHPQETLGYGPIDGLPELRAAVAARFSRNGLEIAPENVLITTSGMHGLDLLGKVLLEPGGLIAGHYPTYLGAIDAWRPHHPTYRTLLLDDPAFDAAAGLAGARFGYVVPNFSNPTGRLVDLATRRDLAAAAVATDTWLIEDDPYGTLQYDGEPLPRVIELAGTADGPVAYLGTLSKQIAPGLRIGWIIGARDLIDALTMAKQCTDMCTSGVTQRIALAAIEGGLIERVQPAIVALYRERRDALCAALAEHLAAWFEWEVPVGGMFVWAVARDPGLDTDRLFAAGLEAGVCVAPSSVFDPAGSYRRALRLNFTLNPPDKLAEGVRRLASVLQKMKAAA